MKIGIGYRRELAAWLATRPPGIDCLEITAEHFYHGHNSTLSDLARDYHLFVHGLGLSLGTPGPLDAQRLEQFARIAQIAQADWVSEHVAFTRAGDIDLGHLNPVRPNHETVRVIAGHAREVAERCGRRLLLENITSHIRMDGELSETDFLTDICEQADCGLLIDVTNLFINSRNHGFDPVDWLHQLPPERIEQLHIVGYSYQGGRYTDGHAQPIQSELLELAQAVMEYAPVRAIILERDADFPDAAAMQTELAKLESLREHTRSQQCLGTPAQ